MVSVTFLELNIFIVGADINFNLDLFIFWNKSVKIQMVILKLVKLARFQHFWSNSHIEDHI